MKGRVCAHGSTTNIISMESIKGVAWRALYGSFEAVLMSRLEGGGDVVEYANQAALGAVELVRTARSTGPAKALQPRTASASKCSQKPANGQ